MLFFIMLFFSLLFLKVHEISAQIQQDYQNLTLVCDENGNIIESDPTNTFTDSRDNHLYSYVTIGDQVWMAENLAYLPEVVGPATNSLVVPYYYVYGYDGTDVTAAKLTSNYTSYGVLYNWPAAMAGAGSSDASPSGVQGICPTGWHLPSDAEWEELKTWLANNGHSGTEGSALKTISGWDSDGNGTDNFGFSGLPGGFRNYLGNFINNGLVGGFWSATEYVNPYEPDIVWYRFLRYNSTLINRDYYGKDYAFSVRCVKDGTSVSTNTQVSNTTLTSGETGCFNATQTITVAGDGSDVIVESGASANFIAGQNIRFLPGFQAQEGSYVHGYITETGDYCVAVPPAIVAAEVETREAVIVDAQLTEVAQREMIVYPNPNNGEFTVEFRNFEAEIQVMLFNSMGQLIRNIQTSEKQIRMSVPNLESGMYYIKAVNAEKQFSQKIVVR